MNTKEVLVVSLIFHDYDIIKKYLDFIVTIKDKADIVVLENYSNSSPRIKETCINLLKSGDILRYYLFDENIYGNAISTFLFNGDFNLSDYKYILLTDGDVTCTDPTWLQQQIEIIDNNPDLFCCAMDLLTDNLPLQAFPESRYWIPEPSHIEKDYVLCYTGVHLCLFKSEIYIKTIDYMKKENKLFTDMSMREYGAILKKNWAKTRNIKAYHHTWDVYADLNHPYTKDKIIIFNNPEMTNKYCEYTSFTLDIDNNVKSMRYPKGGWR